METCAILRGGHGATKGSVAGTIARNGGGRGAGGVGCVRAGWGGLNADAAGAFFREEGGGVGGGGSDHRAADAFSSSSERKPPPPPLTVAEQHNILRGWYVLWSARMANVKRTFDRAAGSLTADVGPRGFSGTLSDVLYRGPIDISVPIARAPPGSQSGVYEYDLVVPDIQFPDVKPRRAFVSPGHVARARISSVVANMEVIPDALVKKLSAAMPDVARAIRSYGPVEGKGTLGGESSSGLRASDMRLVEDLVRLSLINMGALTSFGTFIDESEGTFADTLAARVGLETRPTTTTTTGGGRDGEPAYKGTPISASAPLREKRVILRACSSDMSRLVVRVGLIERGVVQRGLQQVDVAAPDSEELFTHRQAVAV